MQMRYSFVRTISIISDVRSSGATAISRPRLSRLTLAAADLAAENPRPNDLRGYKQSARRRVKFAVSREVIDGRIGNPPAVKSQPPRIGGGAYARADFPQAGEPPPRRPPTVSRVTCYGDTCDGRRIRGRGPHDVQVTLPRIGATCDGEAARTRARRVCSCEVSVRRKEHGREVADNRCQWPTKRYGTSTCRCPW